MMSIEQVQGAGAGAAALLNGGPMTATARAAAAREMAEVLAQVQVAQQVPRNMKGARDRVRDSCEQYRFAKAAFYSYKRGGNTITGPTIKLIRELAAAFGNFQWGLVEVDRDPGRGYSMMQAWAWDVQTNARDSTTFMVRAVRDLAPKEEGGERVKVPLADERDIYENNANMGSRRVRAMMQTLLPAWYVEEAEEWCRATIARGPVNPRTGKPDPLPVRLSNAVDMFARDYQVRQEQLEEVVGAPFGKWGPNDLVRLVTLYESLARGDIRRDEAFPPKVTAADVDRQAAATPQDEPGETGETLRDSTRIQIDQWFADRGMGGPKNRAVRQAVSGAIAGVPCSRWKDLTEAHGQMVLARLDGLAHLAGQEFTGRITALAEHGRHLATAGDEDRQDEPAGADEPGPAGPAVSAVTANRLRARFARDGIGLAGDADTPVRQAIIASLLGGGDPDAPLTEAQGQAAIAAFDAKAAECDRNGVELGAALRQMASDAVAAADEAEILSAEATALGAGEEAASDDG